MWQTGNLLPLRDGEERDIDGEAARGRRIASTHASVVPSERLTPRLVHTHRSLLAAPRRRRSRDAVTSPRATRGAAVAAPPRPPVRRPAAPRVGRHREVLHGAEPRPLCEQRGAAQTHMVAALLRGRFVLERSGRPRDHRPGRRGASIRRALWPRRPACSAEARRSFDHARASLLRPEPSDGQYDGGKPRAPRCGAGARRRGAIHLVVVRTAQRAQQLVDLVGRIVRRPAGGVDAAAIPNVGGGRRRLQRARPRAARLLPVQRRRHRRRALAAAGCVQLLEDARRANIDAQVGRCRADERSAHPQSVQRDKDRRRRRHTARQRVGAIQSLVQYNEHGIDPSVASFCAAGASASSNGSTPLEALGAMLASLERPGYCMLSLYDDYMEPLREHQLHDRHADDPPVVLPAVQRLASRAATQRRTAERVSQASSHR